MQVMISSIPLKIISTLLLTVLLLPVARSQTQSILIDLDSGQLPNDTGLDNRTLLSITDYERLGGKALKVIYAPSDSFGNNNVGETNWGAFETFDFEVYNPPAMRIHLFMIVILSAAVACGNETKIPPVEPTPIPTPVPELLLLGLCMTATAWSRRTKKR